MTLDPKRARLIALLRENDLSMARASAAIGRNTTYLQKYLGRGMPKVLAYQDTQSLARLLGCDPSELQHETGPTRASRRCTKHSARRPLSLISIPEIPFNLQTDPDTIVESPNPQGTPWRIPEPFLLYEGPADSAGVRVLKVEDDAMMPELQGGDRVVFDTSSPWPTLGELYVLWDGNAVVVKRIGWGDNSEPFKYRLLSPGRFHPPYTCLRSEIRFFRNVLWTVRRCLCAPLGQRRPVAFTRSTGPCALARSCA